jgi:uncharacterized protein (DUF2147 family)
MSTTRRRSRLTLPVFALAAVAAIATGGSGHAAAADDGVLGTWLTEAGDQGGRAHVQITRQGDRIAGKIVKLEEPNFEAGHPRAGKPKVDLENPDPKLRERPIIGLVILQGFTHDGGGKWSGGTVYDPANGKTYKAQITLRGRDQLALRGYIGIPMLGRTSTWKRIE